MRALRSLLQAYVVGAYVSVFSTIANLVRGGDAEIRFSGSEMDENELALTLALGLPVAWLLATSPINGRLEQLRRLANYVYLPAGIFAIVLTGSRMGLFAIIPAALFVLLRLPRLKLPSRIVISTALAGAFLFLYPHVPSGTLERLATIESSIASADLGGRVAIWREGIGSFVKHPVLGVGGGAFEGAVPRTRAEAHNIFLSIVVELGIIGLALFAMMLAIAGYRALKQPRGLSSFWMAILLTWGIGAIALTWEHRKATWLFLGLIVISSGLHSREKSAAVEQLSPAPAPRLRV
jgi:O-antigen ligase